MAAPVVEDDVTPKGSCPECVQGKHQNCTDWVLDKDDEQVPCPCAEELHPE